MFSWTLCFITKKKRAESSKILNLFIHAPLLTRDDVRWYFPGVCDVSETTMWHSGQASTTNFPHVILYTKGDDSAKTDPVRCCFWRTWFWPFRLISPAVLIGFTQEANISLEAAVGKILFLSAVFVRFHSRLQSNLIPVPPSIRPTWLQGLYLHTLFLGSKCWILPMPIHPMWNLGPQWKCWN